ncbi:hypothetical protein PSEUBRA_005857 [Kalmanozyma brasiliensis GHG001]|uniref:uncharacterized protein n=1 Tax=Kalmanozyma brasiliensis (strain GHG001) TaxID=1365824 RepID=UPI002867D604|nr:uncharacterized protein PSEUBRA_005857 [Kalmanozyma brasiliensis GHG001]EST05049.2 hypothetical protein PSEUBRA_005857 [Kalmanozyma brasiliensis GHG001]
MATVSPPAQQRLLVALLNRASTNYRLSILNQLVSDASSPFELTAERSLRISLPEDDGLLRSLLSNEIETHGEAETLVKWALKFTASTNFFCVLSLKSDSQEPPASNMCEVFLKDHAPKLWESYGQDEIYFSPDQATAEMQVQLLFPDGESYNALTPLSTSSDLPRAASLFEAPLMTANASNSSQGESVFSQASASTAATSISPHTRPQSRASLVNPTPKANPGSGIFKARAIPSAVTSKPSIEPRLSKAAALRMGVQLPASQNSPARSRVASTSKDASNVGISGVTKRAAPPPVSLKAPSIAPRLNKVALARQGGVASEPAPVPRRSASVASYAFPSTSKSASTDSTTAPVDFSTTPGHKRLSLTTPRSIASIAPPAIAPRQNRASMSRLQTQQPAQSARSTAPPSSFRPARPTDFTSTPGHKRASLSLSIPSLAAPSVAPRPNRASLARTRPTASSPDTATASGQKTTQTRAAPDFSGTPGHKRASLNLSLASLRAPAIAPRLNKAAGARIGLGGVAKSGA